MPAMDHIMAMDPKRLRWRVTLQKRDADKEYEEAGNQEETPWVNADAPHEVWAEVSQRAGQQREDDEIVLDYQMIVVRIRYREDVNEYSRVQWEGRNYKVDGPPVILGRKAGLELNCTLEN